ncbi:hypothetical protein F5Y12DRAFT_215244 [Xylaria sp. FL1777]|nr:hypothetical protein F5Y12DRAFT_215244 [Xylaria sp. FL1777]
MICMFALLTLRAEMSCPYGGARTMSAGAGLRFAAGKTHPIERKSRELESDTELTSTDSFQVDGVQRMFFHAPSRNTIAGCNYPRQTMRASSHVGRRPTHGSATESSLDGGRNQFRTALLAACLDSAAESLPASTELSKWQGNWTAPVIENTQCSIHPPQSTACARS